MNQPNEVKEGEDNIGPVMPYNFETSNDIEQKQLEEDKTNNNKQHVWKWQIRLNHLPFIKIKFMVVQARIPKELHKAKTSFGPTCTFIKATSNP